MAFSRLPKINIAHKAFLITAVFLVLFFVLAKLIIIPAAKDIKNLRNAIITQKIELEGKASKEKNLNTLNEKFKLIEPEFDKLDRIFLDKNRELEFITNLEALAGRHNIAQKINFDPSAGQNEQDYKKITVTLTLTGNFYNLMDYLNDLENTPNLMNVNQINIYAATEGKNITTIDEDPAKKINATLIVFTYWR